MAEIPVERARTIPWWGWMIGIAVAGLAILVVLYAVVVNSDDEETARSPEATPTPVAASAMPTPSSSTNETLTQVRPLFDKPLEQVGRSVDIPDLIVASVQGSHGVFARSEDREDRSFYVWLPSHDDAGHGVEAGQMLSIRGTVQRTSHTDTARFGVAGEAARQMGRDLVYVRADTFSTSTAHNNSNQEVY